MKVPGVQRSRGNREDKLGGGGSWTDAGCYIMQQNLGSAGEPLWLDPTAVLVRLPADDGTVLGVFWTAQMTARELGHSQASADTQSQLT